MYIDLNYHLAKRNKEISKLKANHEDYESFKKLEEQFNRMIAYEDYESDDD